MTICSNKPLPVLSKLSMKPILVVILAAALFTFGCQKQESEAERKAEIERQVQERLAAERQTQDQQRLSQGQVDLDKRVQDLESAQNAAATPAEKVTERERPERDSSDSDEDRTRDEPDGRAGSSYSTFYARLESDGDWIETSNYGYVWQPRVARQSRAWRPYTNGRWVYTDAGWTWISEEPFGWATYHYGRWTRLRNVGWIWVPGSEWAPAWVSWRTSNDYIGWAPLPPEARFERGSGIHNWADSYYDIGPDQYSFVQTSNLGDERLERAIVPSERNVIIVNQTVNVTNITFSNTMVINHGPNYDEVRARSQRPIERVRLERQVSANVNGDLHPVVRGGVVQMEAPVFARAQSGERPRAVRENIAQAIPEHGWDGIADRQAAEKAREKIRSEATPPPNGPSRTFVRPNAAARPERAVAPAVSPSPSVAGTAVPASSAAASPQGSASRVRPGSSAVTPSPAMSPRSTPNPESSPSVSVTPVRPPSPEVTPSPLHRPNRMMSPGTGARVSPTLAPGVRRVAPLGSGPRSPLSPAAPPQGSSPPTEITTPPTTGDANRPAERKREENAQRQLQRPPQTDATLTPTPVGGSPAGQDASSSSHDRVAPESGSSPSSQQLQQERTERQGLRPGRQKASPSPSGTPQER
jgi:hypothetical protein